MINSIQTNLEKFIEENKLQSYKTTANNWILPYTNEKQNKVYIYVNANEESNSIKIGFRATTLKNELAFIESLRTTLLDLNARLKMGALALKRDSNIVEFSVDYPISSEEKIGWKQYNRYVSFCISVCNDLIEKQLIKESILDE